MIADRLPGATRPRRAAFLAGSILPDLNPASYLKRGLHGKPLHGHNFDNARVMLRRRLASPGIRRDKLSSWFTAGMLSHYISDAFTLPHNPAVFHGNHLEHHRYERALGVLFRNVRCEPTPVQTRHIFRDLSALHKEYLSRAGDIATDMYYILRANGLLFSVPCLCGG